LRVVAELGPCGRGVDQRYSWTFCLLLLVGDGLSVIITAGAHRDQWRRDTRPQTVGLYGGMGPVFVFLRDTEHSLDCTFEG
jgi:hypothetical protein